MRRNRAIAPTAGGFTLVELLVVVGIIAVLIAILLPVLSRAREHAYRIKCAANLRSIGHAMTMYTQQYLYYPSSQLWASWGDAAIWPARLRPFLSGNKEVFWCPSRGDEARWDHAGPLPLRRASGVYVDLGYEDGEPLVTRFTPFSYGYNLTGDGSSSGNTDGHINQRATQRGLGVWPIVAGVYDDDRFGEMPVSRIRFPAEMIAVADSDGDAWQDFAIFPDRLTNLLPGRVHSGGANVLFCDGHVSWYAQVELAVDDPPTPQDLAKIRMWNNDHRAPGDR